MNRASGEDSMSSSEYRQTLESAASLISDVENSGSDGDAAAKKLGAKNFNQTPVDSPTSDDATVPEEPCPPSTPRKDIVSGVLSQLEQLIVSDEWSAKGADGKVAHPRRKAPSLPKLSELGRSVVTSYSLKAYIDLLGPQHRHNIATWLYSNTASSLSSIFKFPSAAVHFHEDSVRGGILHAARTALRCRYPELARQGFQALVSNSPVVYVSPALHYDLTHYLALELGLPSVLQIARMEETSLSSVEGRMDHVALEKRMVSDEAEGRRPFLVVAVVGSTFFGQNDLVSRLLELRQKHGFWLHIVGLGLAALAMAEPPEQLVKVLQAVDSITIPLGQWLGVQAVNSITLYSPPSEEFRLSYKEKLECLPWWVVTQHLTVPKIIAAIEFAYKLSRSVLGGLASHHQLAVLGVNSTAEFSVKVERGSLLPPTAITFQYRSPLLLDGAEERVNEVDAEYVDCLNAWMAQGLIGECPQMGLHLAEFGASHGTALRYCAMESAAIFRTSEEDVEHFMKQLDETLRIVDATVRARQQLPELLAGAGSVRRVFIQKWAGVGAVSYIPSIVRDTAPGNWNEKQRQQVSHLNIELVHSLRSSDSAFSVGEDGEGTACVKFGMLADERDLVDLVQMVADRGKSIEESSQYLESLAEMVRQGIEAANQDLKKENEEKLMQEGVLRQVPLVGSLLNWWAPLPQNTVNIKGRAFDLKTGRIESTEVIYKHKLQMQLEGEEFPLTPATPIDTPQVPHGFRSDDTHSDTEEAKD